MPYTVNMAGELNSRGVEQRRGIIPENIVSELHALADRWLRGGPASHSIPLAQIHEAGLDLLAAVRTAGLDASACRLEHSWLRRKTPPDCRPHIWHQDGGLGAQFPPAPGPAIPMTPLLTLWVPLDPCGVEAPGLEFVCRPLNGLLHFTELNDAELRHRFAPDEFWAPAMEPGDVLLFRGGTLHRTHYRPDMRRPRTSLEYRLFQDSAMP